MECVFQNRSLHVVHDTKEEAIEGDGFDDF